VGVAAGLLGAAVGVGPNGGQLRAVERALAGVLPRSRRPRGRAVSRWGRVVSLSGVARAEWPDGAVAARTKTPASPSTTERPRPSTPSVGGSHRGTSPYYVPRRYAGVQFWFSQFLVDMAHWTSRAPTLSSSSTRPTSTSRRCGSHRPRSRWTTC
jgi:hypothetical protein